MSAHEKNIAANAEKIRELDKERVDLKVELTTVKTELREFRGQVSDSLQRIERATGAK